MRNLSLPVSLATLLSVAIAVPSVAAAPAAIVLNDAMGKSVGSATLAEQGGNLVLSVSVSGLPAGTHGIHIHTVGTCTAPDFASAGGHWNPTAKKHGLQNPAGHHSGDLPNLVIGADGTGKLTATITGASFAELFDSDGAALVIHAQPDDMMTDPSGNSGPRIACGVITPPA